MMRSNKRTVSNLLALALLAGMASTYADAFTAKTDESNRSGQLLRDIDIQLQELKQRIAELELSAGSHSTSTSASKDPANAFPLHNPKLSLEQEVALREQLNGRYEALGKVNNKNIVRKGNEILMLSDVEFEQLFNVESELIVRALLNGTAPQEEHVLSSPPNLAPATPENAGAKVEPQKNTAQQSAKDKLEARRKASREKAQAKPQSTNSYRAQSSSSYRAINKAPPSLLVLRPLRRTETDGLQVGFQVGIVSPMASGPL